MKWKGIIAGLTAAAIWGGLYVISKIVMEVVPPFSLLTIRLILGLLALWPFVVWSGGLHFSSQDYLRILGAGAIGFGISIGLQFVGTHLSTASNGAVVTSATPVFALLFAAWLFGEVVTRRRLMALLIATVGVLIVVDLRNARLIPDMFWGNLALLAAALTWALYSVLIGKIARHLDVIKVSFIALMGGLPFVMLMAISEIPTWQQIHLSLPVWAGIMYIGLGATALAMVLWNYAFARLDAGLAALTFFAQPVIGTLLSAIFLREVITLNFLLGSGLIALGVVQASRD